ncbi:MAG: hypothetical protein ACPGWR_27075 [Ardenticatenaceae bacterium]
MKTQLFQPTTQQITVASLVQAMAFCVGCAFYYFYYFFYFNWEKTPGSARLGYGTAINH